MLTIYVLTDYVCTSRGVVHGTIYVVCFIHTYVIHVSNESHVFAPVCCKRSSALYNIKVMVKFVHTHTSAEYDAKLRNIKRVNSNGQFTPHQT